MRLSIRDLPSLLETGKADYILLHKPYEKQGVENILLGFEENVLVEPKSGNYRKDVFLDHDSEDSTTTDFFKIQSKSPEKYKCSYFDEIYAIIDGVIAGAGRAVIPLHLALQFKELSVTKGYRSLKTPVYLVYYQQALHLASKASHRKYQVGRSKAPSTVDFTKDIL